jgi:hypothetical protein
LEEDLDLLLKLKDVGATACWEAPVFDNYSDFNEEYLSFNTTRSSQSRGGLGDEEDTARWAAPALENDSLPDGHTESFLGNHLGLTITSMPQRRKAISCTARALSPPNYSITSPALWPSY